MGTVIFQGSVFLNCFIFYIALINFLYEIKKNWGGEVVNREKNSVKIPRMKCYNMPDAALFLNLFFYDC